MFYIWTEIVNKWKMVAWILSGYSLFPVLFSFFFFQGDFSTHIPSPGGSNGKESACNAGGARDWASVPGLGRSPGEGNGKPLQYSCLGNPMDRRTLMGQCPWNFPSKKTGMDCHFLLQGIFPTQGSNPCLLHCRRILYRLCHLGGPFSYWISVLYVQVVISGATFKKNCEIVFSNILLITQLKAVDNVTQRRYNLTLTHTPREAQEY